MSQGSVLKAGVMGGILAGLAASVPIVNLVNQCCCGLVVVGGVFAAWVLRSDSGRTAGGLRCVMAGFLTGLVAAGIFVPLGAVLARLAFGVDRLEEDLARSLQILRDLPVQQSPIGIAMSEKLQRAMLGLDFNAWTLVGTAIAMPFSAAFGALGGALGSVIFRRRSAVAAWPESVAPPPATPLAPPPVGVPPRDGVAAGSSSGEAHVSGDAPRVVPGRPAEGEIPLDELPELPDGPAGATEPDDSDRGDGPT